MNYLSRDLQNRVLDIQNHHKVQGCIRAKRVRTRPADASSALISRCTIGKKARQSIESRVFGITVRVALPGEVKVTTLASIPPAIQFGISRGAALLLSEQDRGHHAFQGSISSWLFPNNSKGYHFEPQSPITSWPILAMALSFIALSAILLVRFTTP